MLTVLLYIGLWWGDTLPSASCPAWWWCSLLCHTGTWPVPSWHGMDGAIGSPGISQCVGASCRRWHPGRHPLSSGARCRERAGHHPSPPPQSTWWTVLHCWGGLGALSLCPSSRYSRCHQHISSRGFAGADLSASSSKNSMYRFATTADTGEPIAATSVAEVGWPQACLKQFCDPVRRKSSPVCQRFISLQFVINNLDCFINWNIGEEGGHVKPDQHLIFFKPHACHHLHEVLWVLHMRVSLAC